MTPESFSERLDDLLSGIIEKSLAKIDKAQGSVLNEILTLVSDLEKDKGGNIKATKANLRILRDIETRLPSALVTPEYDRSVKYFTAELESIREEIDGYLSGTFKEFDPNTATFERIMIEAVGMTEDVLLREGFKMEIINKVRSIISTNVTSGLPYRDLVGQVREFLEADGGRLARWAKTIVTDAAFQTSRNYIQKVAQDVDASYWRYIGGRIKHTRPFCDARDGKYYTTEEVRSWASLDWDGKNPLTTADTIFTYCGGYNCRHNLIPVLKDDVPEDQR